MKRRLGYAALGVLAGAGLIALGIHLNARAHAAASWPTANGVVLEYGVEREREHTDNPSSIVYRPWVRYRYSVKGVEYAGARLTAGVLTEYDSVRAQSHVSRFDRDRQVKVHYDPANPGDSLLDPKDYGAVPFGTGLMLLGALVGVAALVAAVVMVEGRKP